MGIGGLFLFQSLCSLCKRPCSSILCVDCGRQLQRCRRKHSERLWQGELPLWVWGDYEGMLKRAIATLKYDRTPSLAQILGQELGKGWLHSPLSSRLRSVSVVSIPLHSQKLSQRGFNQAELIGRSFCQYTHLKFQPQGLKRIRATQAQYTLNAKERAENLRSAFALGKKIHSPVLLLDDIYTTGATAHAAAQAFRQQNIKVVGMIAMATSQATNS